MILYTKIVVLRNQFKCKESWNLSLVLPMYFLYVELYIIQNYTFHFIHSLLYEWDRYKNVEIILPIKLNWKRIIFSFLFVYNVWKVSIFERFTCYHGGRGIPSHPSDSEWPVSYTKQWKMTLSVLETKQKNLSKCVLLVFRNVNQQNGTNKYLNVDRLILLKKTCQQNIDNNLYFIFCFRINFHLILILQRS